MADLARSQIVSAFVTALTGLATTGNRVFDSDVYPLDEAELPGLLVYWTMESSQPDTITSDLGVNRLQVSVVAVAASNDTLRATLDQVCKEVQQALASGIAFPSPSGQAWMSRTGAAPDRGRGERPTGQVTINYEVTYYSAESAPDVIV